MFKCRKTLEGKNSSFLWCYYILPQTRPLTVAPNSKIWWMDGERLEITRKGKKEGNNRRPVKVFVAIAYQKGIIMYEQWNPNIPFLLNVMPTRKINLSFKTGAQYKSGSRLNWDMILLTITSSVFQQEAKTWIPLKTCFT